MPILDFRKLDFKSLKDRLASKEKLTLRKFVLWAIIGLTALVVGGGIILIGLFGILSIGLPDVTDIDKINPAQSTEIFDKNGGILYTVHGDENRQKVTYENISKNLIDATVSIEDDGFWTHKGFDVLAIAKAAVSDVLKIGTPRGGSTITQQYIKTAFLSPEKSYVRKIRELILASRLEKSFNKKEILALYLNRIPYGNNTYGCEKASQTYFNKPCKDLDLAESSILASIPQAPTHYNPYGNNKFSHLLKTFTKEELFYRKIKGESDLNTEDYARGLIGQHIDLGNGQKFYLQGRSDLVLKRMFELKKITTEQRQAALNELQKIEFKPYRESIKAAHFVFYVKQYLEDRYGKDAVENGGLKVYTTIDPDLQAFAEKTVKEVSEANQKSINANNAAALTVNVKTGEILAMVGSRDYFDETIDGNVNVILRPRQPGSSFKPIVYARAFMEGYGPASVTYDVPTKVGNDTPQNFDGKWRGQMSLRLALGQSRNIPAVQAYFLAKQQQGIIELAQLMGITTLDPNHDYGYPLAIGAGEIPPIEMVTAYATFANGGKKPDLTGILRIENANGDILEEYKPKEFKEVLDPQVAYLINSILSDQSTGLGGNIFLGNKVNAAKSGTSTKQNKKEAKAAGTGVRPSDLWVLGYTPTIATGVWVGNTKGEGLAYNAEAYVHAAPIFKKILAKATENLPNESFPVPKGIQNLEVSKSSGLLPGPNTPASMIVKDVFTSFGAPTQIDDSLFTVKIDSVSGKLATEFTPKEAVVEATYVNFKPIADMFNWAQEIKNYYEANPDKSPQTQAGDIRIGVAPTEYDDVHTAQTAEESPTISILSPTTGDVLPYGDFNVMVKIESKREIKQVDYYIDDKKLYFANTAPYRGFLNVFQVYEPGSKHLVVAKVVDVLGYSGESAIEIKVGEK